MRLHRIESTFALAYVQNVQNAFDRFAANALSLTEFLKRLRRLNFRFTGDFGGHFKILSPDGQHMQCVSGHNWVKNWRLIREDMLHYNPDLEFVWEPDFVIPPNFNVKTMRLDKPAKAPDYITMFLPRTEGLPADLTAWEVLENGAWHHMQDIDWRTYELMLDDTSIVPLHNNMQIRKPNKTNKVND